MRQLSDKSLYRLAEAAGAHTLRHRLTDALAVHYKQPDTQSGTSHGPVHSPEGGATAAGTFFPGGQFIPKQFLAAASAEEMSKLGLEDFDEGADEPDEKAGQDPASGQPSGQPGEQPAGAPPSAGPQAPVAPPPPAPSPNIATKPPTAHEFAGQNLHKLPPPLQAIGAGLHGLEKLKTGGWIATDAIASPRAAGLYQWLQAQDGGPGVFRDGVTLGHASDAGTFTVTPPVKAGGKWTLTYGVNAPPGLKGKEIAGPIAAAGQGGQAGAIPPADPVPAAATAPAKPATAPVADTPAAAPAPPAATAPSPASPSPSTSSNLHGPRSSLLQRHSPASLHSSVPLGAHRIDTKFRTADGQHHLEQLRSVPSNNIKASRPLSGEEAADVDRWRNMIAEGRGQHLPAIEVEQGKDGQHIVTSGHAAWRAAQLEGQSVKAWVRDHGATHEKVLGEHIRGGGELSPEVLAENKGLHGEYRKAAAVRGAKRVEKMKAALAERQRMRDATNQAREENRRQAREGREQEREAAKTERLKARLAKETEERKKGVNDSGTPRVSQAAMRAVSATAAEYSVPADELLDHLHDFHAEKSKTIIEREQAKQRARQIAGITQADFNRLSNSGKDHTAVKGFDVAARQIATELPELGLGGRGYESGANFDDTDYAAQVWELIGEGRIDPPAKHDPGLIREAAEQLAGAKKYRPADELEAVPFRRIIRLAGIRRQVERTLYRRGMANALAVRYAGGGGQWDESKHPRGQPENAGEFAEKQGDGNKRPMKSITVFRLQPVGLELAGHQSETSGGEADRGPHVFGSLSEASNVTGWTHQKGEWELLEIEADAKDVRDNADYEGYVLLGGRGRIAKRTPLGDWRAVLDWAATVE